jgi:dihydroxyacid dehydratase/phosphogluconate dehydratase
MQVLRAAGLFAANAVWRATGSQAAGRTLLNALASSDPNIRTIAGMFLVRGGDKAVPFIEEALHRQLNLPQVLVMAGDIGSKKLEPELQKFAAHPDPQVSRAARDGLKIMAAQNLKPAAR